MMSDYEPIEHFCAMVLSLLLGKYVLKSQDMTMIYNGSKQTVSASD